jgi:hypothetical protein
MICPFLSWHEGSVTKQAGRIVVAGVGTEPGGFARPNNGLIPPVLAGGAQSTVRDVSQGSVIERTSKL